MKPIITYLWVATLALVSFVATAMESSTGINQEPIVMGALALDTEPTIGQQMLAMEADNQANIDSALQVSMEEMMAECANTAAKFAEDQVTKYSSAVASDRMGMAHMYLNPTELTRTSLASQGMYRWFTVNYNMMITLECGGVRLYVANRKHRDANPPNQAAALSAIASALSAYDLTLWLDERGSTDHYFVCPVGIECLPETDPEVTKL